MRSNQITKYSACENESKSERQQKEFDFKQDFGIRLSDYLKDNDIKVDTFANEIGYDRQHIYGICSGKKAPSLFCLWRISECLGISIDYIWKFNNSFSDSGLSTLESKKTALHEKIDNIEDEKIIELLISQIDGVNKIIRPKMDKTDKIDNDTAYPLS